MRGSGERIVKKATQYIQSTDMAPLKPYGAYAIYISNSYKACKRKSRTHKHIEKIIQFDDVAAVAVFFPLSHSMCVCVCVSCTLICTLQKKPF